MLFDACDRWLRDPDDPSRYDIGPRASDVRITYEVKGDDGKPVRNEAPLSELLARRDGVAPDVRMVETKNADPRELLLQTARGFEGHAELMGRHTYCAARLQTLDYGAPVSMYAVSRELGHGSEDMVRRVYSHLGTVRDRSDVVEFRVEQHFERLGDQLRRLGFVITPDIKEGTGGQRRSPRHRGIDGD